MKPNMAHTWKADNGRAGWHGSNTCTACGLRRKYSYRSMLYLVDGVWVTTRQPCAKTPAQKAEEIELRDLAKNIRDVMDYQFYALVRRHPDRAIFVELARNAKPIAALLLGIRRGERVGKRGRR